MEENRFFKLVWRFNGLILMIAGVLAIGLLIFVGYTLIKEKTSNRNVTNIINIQEETDIKEKWKLGHISNIQGSSYIMVPLTSDQNYAQSYYSKSSSSIRNYLFINSKDNTQNWLFDNNKYLINSINLLPNSQYNEKKKNVKAIMYQIVKQDSNKDSRLTSDDLQTVALSLPDGTGYKEIIHNVDNFVGQSLVDENTMLIIYQIDGIGFSVIVDLSSFKVTNETVLKAVNS